MIYAESLSLRRAWIEMILAVRIMTAYVGVALLTESVD